MFLTVLFSDGTGQVDVEGCIVILIVGNENGLVLHMVIMVGTNDAGTILGGHHKTAEALLSRSKVFGVVIVVLSAVCFY